MLLEDFEITVPQLRTTGRMLRNESDSDPSLDDEGGVLLVGTELLREDTGKTQYWDGSAWQPITLVQRLGQIGEFLREIRDLLTREG